MKRKFTLTVLFVFLFVSLVGSAFSVSAEDNAIVEDDTITGEIFVATPDVLLAEAAGKSMDFEIVTDGDKTYFRATATVANGNGINWTISDPLDAFVYNYMLISYKTNVKTVYNNAFAIQLSKDNTFTGRISILK